MGGLCLNVFFKFFLFLFVCLTFIICVKHSLTHSHNFFVYLGGSVSVGQCALLIWPNSAGWTGWKVTSVLAEW